jgi:hypothetical protein
MDGLLGYYYKSNFESNEKRGIHVYKVVRTLHEKYGHYSKPAYKAFEILNYDYYPYKVVPLNMIRIPPSKNIKHGENLTGDFTKSNTKEREGRQAFRFSGTNDSIYNLLAPMKEARKYGVDAIGPNELNRINEDIKNMD